MIFSRPDAGLADGFGIAVDIGRSAAGAELFDGEFFNAELGDEISAAESPAAEVLAAEAGETSTFTNVLCGSKLAATCLGTAPLRAATSTGVSMPWMQVASQLKNSDGA